VQSQYLEIKNLKCFPRLPLKGNIDLTYRCNNNCIHCWSKNPEDDKKSKQELSFAEIKDIINQAVKMGCNQWGISGGEPMLRPDFLEILDYINSKSAFYSLNTNGTLITPKIARHLKKRGAKIVALYGATDKVHDRITRNPGSFEATMRGFRYLKEAGAGFIVRIIPMKANYHEFNDMVKLAKSLSGIYKVGSPWIFLSSRGDSDVNERIKSQRLSVCEAMEINRPNLGSSDICDIEGFGHNDKGLLFKRCILTKSDFHIDPYGYMSFCMYIRRSDLRYNLRKGSIAECWDDFIPSLADRLGGGKEYKKNCGTCNLRLSCIWCGVYGYLEHGRFSAKVGYLCQLAEEKKRRKEILEKDNRRRYSIAGLGIRVDSDLPIKDSTFSKRFKEFESHDDGKNDVSIRHYFFLPKLTRKDLGEKVYHRQPWLIYKKMNSWIYIKELPSGKIDQAAVFNNSHTRVRVYNATDTKFLKGDLKSITLMPSDQIMLARALADLKGFYLHASGVNMKGRGFLFAGHSGAGKSTVIKMLRSKAEILCDDRIILRKYKKDFKIHGTWSHGEIEVVSNSAAPLKAVVFLKKSNKNMFERLEDKKRINALLLSFLIKPLTTADWWDKILPLIEEISCKVPCYLLHFDKSGKIAELIEEI